jgi:hypothetical protein
MTDNTEDDSSKVYELDPDWLDSHHVLVLFTGQWTATRLLI